MLHRSVRPLNQRTKSLKDIRKWSRTNMTRWKTIGPIECSSANTTMDGDQKISKWCRKVEFMWDVHLETITVTKEKIVWNSLMSVHYTNNYIAESQKTRTWTWKGFPARESWRFQACCSRKDFTYPVCLQAGPNLHFCDDCRRQNVLSVRDSYPIPPLKKCNNSV